MPVVQHTFPRQKTQLTCKTGRLNQAQLRSDHYLSRWKAKTKTRNCKIIIWEKFSCLDRKWEARYLKYESSTVSELVSAPLRPEIFCFSRGRGQRNALRSIASTRQNRSAFHEYERSEVDVWLMIIRFRSGDGV